MSCFLNSVIEEDEYEDDEVVEVDISALGTSSSVITEAKPQDDHHFVRIFNECQAHISVPILGRLLPSREIIKMMEKSAWRSIFVFMGKGS